MQISQQRFQGNGITPLVATVVGSLVLASVASANITNVAMQWTVTVGIIAVGTAAAITKFKR